MTTNRPRGQALQSAHDLQVLADGQLEVGGGSFHEVAGTTPCCSLTARHLGAKHAYRSSGGRDHAEQHADQGRLAGAVEPEQGVDLSGLHLQADAIYGHDVAVALERVDDLDDRHASTLPDLDGR
ncbi:hypothetical protein GCM10010412_098530 [Nonomuraea recticatena]|uniref:Uncharacterized protein n=1 Tax=Nonomuraea recticatena TaxID=46178 RepID=A0ABP6FUY9_9ACTN